MKYIKQFLIIIFISLLGELLNLLLPLPVPATVWGMCLMFAALCTGIVKLDAVEETANFFVSIIAMLFIPYGVSLMANFDLLADYAWQIVIITFASFFGCFIAAGKTVDFIIDMKGRKEKSNE